MTEEHDKLQDKEDSCYFDQSSKKNVLQSRSFLIFPIAAVFLIAIILWGLKFFSPSASESTSGSELSFITEVTSKRKAADFLKKEMLEIASRLVAEFPSNERLRILAVEAHLNCQNFTQAEALLEEGIRLNPGYGEFYQRMARIVLSHGEHDKAITYWIKTLEVSPEKLNLNVKIADSFISLGKYREAIGRLQKHIKISPESAWSYYLLGQGYLQLKEYDESKKYFKKAIELRPNHPQANYGLANIYICG